MFKKQDWTGNQVQSDNKNTKSNGKLIHFDDDANDGKPVMHGTVLRIETITKNKASFPRGMSSALRKHEDYSILQTEKSESFFLPRRDYTTVIALICLSSNLRLEIKYNPIIITIPSQNES